MEVRRSLNYWVVYKNGLPIKGQTKKFYNEEKAVKFIQDVQDGKATFQ
jgi:hypothetical protein